MEDKKYILYVDRDYLDGRNSEDVPIRELHSNEGYQGFRTIRESVRKNFDLNWMFDFDERVFEEIKQSKNHRKFNALITHLPFEGDEGMSFMFPMAYHCTIYRKSLDLLEKIRDMDEELAILVYSGMSQDYHYLPLYSGADRVLKKTDNHKEDAKEVNDFLDYSFTELPEIRRKRKERANQPPKIEIINNQIQIDTVLNLRLGIGLFGLSKIHEGIKDYDGKIMIHNLEKKTSADCRNFLDIVHLSLYEMTPVRITVDRDDQEARKSAKKLYSAITSEDERKISFDRFE